MLQELNSNIGGPIENKIYTIRGTQVMLDFDFDRVKSQLLASSGISDLKSQIVISSWGGTRKLPYAFTEQGIYMLATVLRGETAERQSIFIMRAFREMRRFLQSNSHLFSEISTIKKHLVESDIHHRKNDERIDSVRHQGDCFDRWVRGLDSA